MRSRGLYRGDAEERRARRTQIWIGCGVVALAILLAGCGARAETDVAEAGAPPQAQVIHEQDLDFVKVNRPDQFPLATAAEYDATPTLAVTGVVQPDVSRNVPVISLASGRILEINAKLGDTVTKGQLLMRVQSADIAQAFSDYRQAMADETLSAAQLARAQLLYEKGAIAQKDVEVAQDADAKAKVTVETAREHLRVLGANMANPASIVDIYAPASGVITDQQVTTAAGTQGLASPNAFTISDLSHVWIVCDVYENDLSFVHLNEFADIRLNAYPDLHLQGRIDNIGPILDPNIRTAKVRIQMNNPGPLRLGMFVTATFHSQQRRKEASVPAAAVLHLHDRDWVYVPIEGGRFHRISVDAGDMLAAGRQAIRSGIEPGTRVVADALVLQSTVEQ